MTQDLAPHAPSARPPSRRRPLVLFVAPIVVAVLGIGLLAWRPWRPAATQLADLGTAPTFSLTDQNARPVRSADLAGKVQIVSFLFPYCSTYCPYTTHQLLTVENRLTAAGLADKVHFTAFNLAPADSGPSDMASYLKQYGVDPADPHWSFLTGSQSEVDAAVRGGYGLQYERIPLDAGGPNGADAVPVQPNALADAKHVNFDIAHNEVINLVGGDGVIRGAFDHVVDVTTDELYGAITKLLAAHR